MPESPGPDSPQPPSPTPSPTPTPTPGSPGSAAADTLTDAAVEFTEERHLAILSTPGLRGRIHSVAVGFTLSDGIARIITSDGTQKVRNVERAGTATVAQVDGRRWLSLSGQARIRREPDEVARAVELYAGRYRQPSPNPRRVVIEIAVTDVLGSPGMRV